MEQHNVGREPTDKNEYSADLRTSLCDDTTRVGGVRENNFMRKDVIYLATIYAL